MTEKRLRATVRLLTPGEGGRASPIQSGWRGVLRSEGWVDGFGVELEFDGMLGPSGTTTGTMRVWAAHLLPTSQAGDTVQLFEGRQLVAVATVIG